MSEKVIHIEEGHNTLIAVKSMKKGDREELTAKADWLSSFDKAERNKLLMYLNKEFESIGFLGSIYVDYLSRGKGKGAELMGIFKKEVEPDTQVDFLFAEVKQVQKKGFNLLEFYQKRGFEPVKHSNGEMLMVNKGYARQIRSEVFGLFSILNINNENNKDKALSL